MYLMWLNLVWFVILPRMTASQNTSSSQLRQHYARVVRELREKAGITQHALGNAAGVHRVYVNQVETATINFSIDSLDRLLKVLSPSLDKRSLRVRLAENLKVRRGELSQEAFATVLDVPVLYVSRVERFVVATSIDQIDRLADKLKIDGTELLS